MTLRLGDQTSKYPPGRTITLIVGWDATDSVVVGRIKILDCLSVPIKSLTDRDLEGESPDCKKVESVPYVLSAIYRRIVSEDDVVTIVRWTYVE